MKINNKLDLIKCKYIFNFENSNLINIYLINIIKYIAYFFILNKIKGITKFY
jgi:hypothetical protein